MATNPLSSLSYTNKDFNSIYVELLDLVKKLTYKWDPSISNESDPGVILLKLDAIIGDKNNYNIDKNILEAFPETVTQEINARNNYKQLAYRMPWYQSATTKITMKWVGEELADGVVVKIPRYTMITNENTEVIYTIIDEPTFDNQNLIVTARAIEGVIITHTVNGSDIIDITNLDSNNRLFLNDYSVAENGIFITNDGDSDLNLWKQVDNLQIKTQGNKYYEFDVDSRNGVCFVEFPEDIDALIKSGLRVRYLLSSGSDGNIAAKTLDRFYEENSIKVAGEDVVLSSEVVQLYNPSESTDGTNPQELSAAYKSYRKTAGTFDTLVTLRDYINAIYNSGLVSNGFVCDRSNDIQTSYSVVVDDNVNPVYTYQTEKKSEDLYRYNVAEEEYVSATIPQMTAFDLKLYLLHSAGTISNIDHYESTFDMEASDSTAVKEVLGYISEQKCIQHDFEDLLPDIPCMFQNSFPICIKIVPQSYLTDLQISEVKVNIVKALFDVVNSRAIEFGEEPSYDIIYDAIVNADSRIKLAILDDFKYTTLAVYWDGKKKEFKKIPISSMKYNSSDLIIPFNSVDELEKYKSTSETRKKAAYFIYTGDTTENAAYKPYSIWKYNTAEEAFQLYSDKLLDFQKQIIIKNVLAGKTPLFVPESSFSYSMSQDYVAEVETNTVTTNLTIAPYAESNKIKTEEITLKNGDKIVVPTPINSESNTKTAEYKLTSNESIRLLAPSFITSKTFSNYVKFELVLQKGSGELIRERILEESDISAEAEYMITKEDCATAILNAFNHIVSYEKLEGDIALTTDFNPTDYINNTLVNIGENEYVNYRDWKVWSSTDIAYAKWIEAFNNFTGQDYPSISDKDSFDYAKALSYVESEYIAWKFDVSKSMCCGTFVTSSIVSGSQIKKQISDYDIIQHSAYRVSSAKITVYQEKTAYTIAANTDYQLKENESITFFWREEDTDDAPYRYEHYVGIAANKQTATRKSPIIRSNFTIHATSVSQFTGLDSTGKIPYGDDAYIVVSGFYGDNDLSGTKTIDIREMNQVILDRESGKYKQKNKYYFITSTKNRTDKKNVYSLTLKKTVDTETYTEQPDKNSENNKLVTYRYTLENDEYFIYTSNDMTEFEILGAGTLIGINVSSSDIYEKNDRGEYEAPATITLTNEAVEYSQLINEGITSFYDFCNSVPQSYEMFCREQQIYTIVEGDNLKLEVTDRTKMFNENKHLFPEGWTEAAGVIYNNEKKVVYPAPYFTTHKETVVAGFDIRYSTATNNEITLPKLDIQNDPDCRWIGKSYLNLSTALDDKQSIVACIETDAAIKSSQSILAKNTVYPQLNNDVTEHIGDIHVDLESNIVLDKVGGEDIDISYLDGTGERKLTELYIYKQNKAFDKDPYDTTDDGLVLVKFPTTSIDDTNNDKYERDLVLDGKYSYIFGIQNTSQVSKFQFCIDGKPLTSLGVAGLSEFGAGTHYFLIPASDSSSHTINFTFNLADEPVASDVLIIQKLLKCTYNKLFDEDYGYLFSNQEDIFSSIRAYDYEGRFKYDYQVKEEECVKDPLLSESFFDENHVFNPFTMGKAELRISDATDSTITIVNNR